MQTFMIADTHFTDDSILRYENRPFADVREMDRAMIERWNAAVGSGDRVFVLGDFGAQGAEAQTLAMLNGVKYLVKGNHDCLTNAQYRSFGFAEVYDYPILFEGFWILSHEPVYVNTNMPYANLFGHVHDSPVFRDCSAQHFCVCVERTDYAPVPLDEIRRRVKEAVNRQHPPQYRKNT